MTQPLWTSIEAANATGGKAASEWQADAVVIDSRVVTPGALFVAIVGERVDGHHYVKEALEKGAAAAMVSQPIEGVPAEKLLVVEDTLKGLEALGKHARARTRAKIIGVTGSVGKTTTKEALKVMCREFGRTHTSEGNYNNHYGVPLSLANMREDTELGIFEMGMNHAGEISLLTKMVRPHVAIITAVEAVHLEFFDSVQGIAAAKAEIFEGLEPGGTAILPADNEHADFIKNSLLSLWERQALSANEESVKKAGDGPHPNPLPGGEGEISILSFGQQIDADIRLGNVELDEDGSMLDVICGGHLEHVSSKATGKAAISAALVCMSVAKALDLDLHHAALSLASIEEVKGRGRVEKVHVADKEMWFIDDSYNASPASMRAAFEKLANVTQQKQATRSVAVLGDMLELGDQTPDLHAGLAQDLAAYGIHAAYLVGTHMQHLKNALPASQLAGYTLNIEDMRGLLKDQLRSGDVVLFKGSNGSNIHQLVKELRDEG